jgi:two-component system cell cycle sensor histidine kinase/response regulator CckA
LNQVFLNLLVNAAQSLDVGRAAENCVAIKTWTDQSDNAIIEISDTGAGIPESAMDRIFDPFFTTKQIGSGTGLGLSVCHSIVTSIGGQITVRSQVGEGTTVRVRLKPAEDISAHPADKQPASGPVKSQRKELRILVVDDEPAVARSLRRALHGHQVTVSLNGRDAMDRIIFITGGAFTQRAKDFLESIPNKWLEKPFNIQEIQELVRQRAAA